MESTVKEEASFALAGAVPRIWGALLPWSDDQIPQRYSVLSAAAASQTDHQLCRLLQRWERTSACHPWSGYCARHVRRIRVSDSHPAPIFPALL